MADPRKFDEYFRSIYSSRWEALLTALQSPARQISRKPFDPQAWTWHETALPSPNEYILDPASLVAAKALGVRPGDQVLDLCAAPGGKTLILLEALQGQGHLISNEPSYDRRERLKRVIQQYVPKENRLQVEIRGKDGMKYGITQAESFDRILVDAPCSGERHLLEHPQELARWTPRRSKNLSMRQFGLLSSAWLAVKPGGSIVYSTCTISPQENDEVIAKLIQRHSPLAEVHSPTGDEWDELKEFYSLGERTHWGWIFLPDRCGFGPLYYSRIVKAAPLQRESK